jgi:5'-nucleotidase
MALAPLGDLLVVAPLHQHSGTGRSFPKSSGGNIHRLHLAWNGRSQEAFAVESSPAQTVVHALIELAPQLPDLAVVGINYGENLGEGITSSGTVGAALEAASAGVRTLAVSLQTAAEYHYSYSPEIDFSAAAYFTQLFARRLISPGVELPHDVDLLKIDVPQGASPGTPWRVTRVSRRRYFESLRPQRAQLEESHWLDYRTRDEWEDLEPDSDIYALRKDCVVSVSPVSLDLSSRVDRRSLERSLGGRP